MLITRTEFLGSLFLFVVAAPFPRVAACQSAEPPAIVKTSELPCGEERRAVLLTGGEEERWLLSSQRLPGPSTNECAAGFLASSMAYRFSRPMFVEHRLDDVPSARRLEPPPSTVPKHYPVYPPLAVAHEAVLEILSANNSCSMWLQQFDPDIVATFQSLRFQIEAKGPDYAIQERIGGVRTEHGPYSARTMQSAGPGSIVTVNGNGPFFHARLDLYSLNFPGGAPFQTGNRTFAHVGPYEGGSFRAQIIILLHELAHVIGAIPEDDSSKFGFKRSQNNTSTVLLYCRLTAETFVKNNAVVLTTAASGDPPLH